MTSNINSKQRTFGGAENALIKISLQHQGFMKVVQVLHLQGPYIPLEALEQAVVLLQQRHPFLRSRLQNNPAKANSYLMEEDSTFHLKIRQLSRKREDHLIFWRQEWRQREKDIPIIGEGLVEFWLLQDPQDNQVEDGLREIVVICDHSICDGISLSNLSHELLLALGSDDKNMFDHSLNWPITIEAAVQASLSKWARFVKLSKFIASAFYWRSTKGRNIARIPFANIDFQLNEMTKHCYTEFFYGSLNKEETQKLVEICRREGVTVTSAISSAILCTASTLVIDQRAYIAYSIPADSRRRCVPPVPNHDLSYQVSALNMFSMPANNTPTTVKGMWKLAKAFGEHMKSSINAGHVLTLGTFMGTFYEISTGPIDLSGCPTCGITNWGILPFQEHYGKWELKEMIPSGNLIRLPMPMAFVQTVNGILTIGYCGAAPAMAATTLESLRNGAMDNLHRMIED